MNWILGGLLALALYWISTLDKRVKQLEADKHEGFSFSYNFDFTEAVRKHPAFAKLSGIKSADETLDYTKWTKAEQKINDELYPILRAATAVRLGYMAPTETFFYNNGESVNLVLKRFDTTGIYSKVVLGDPEGTKESLSLQIDARIVELNGGYFEVLTAYLEHSQGYFRDNKVTHIFDFPYTRMDMTDEKFQSMGFEVKHEGGDDFYHDSFGKGHSIPRITTLKKNDSKIRIVS